MKTIKETIIKQIEFDELDFVVQDQLLGENPNGHDYDFHHDKTQMYWNEGDYIPIEMLQKAIDELKNEGVTHIQIYPHGDHHGYYITGVKLEVVDDETAKELKENEIRKEISKREEVYNRNQSLLAQEMDEIGKLYEKLEKLHKSEG